MISKSTPFAKSQLDVLLSAYYSGLTSTYYGIEESDLDAAVMTTAIRNDPKQAVRQISAGFTCPTKFFGVHTRDPASIAALGAAGAKTLRLRDTGCNWGETVANQAAVTFTAGSTNTVNWASHGGNATDHVFAVYTSSAFPTGITNNKLYFIVGAAAGTFQLSLTEGGAPINLGTTGSGCTGMLIRKSVMHPGGVTGRLDQITNAAAAAGMDVVYDCSRPPIALTSGSVDSHGRTNTPVTSQTYVSKWMQLLYALYPEINYFEAWNEPNDPSQFAGTISGAANDLYNYTNWWYQAANAYTGGAAKVISPSFNVITGAAAMTAWLASPSSGNNVVHVIGFHNYRGGMVQLGYSNDALDAYLASAAANAPGKEVWITEVGESYPTADILWRAHMYAAASGVARMFWYTYDMSPGLGDMRLSSYAGLADAYRAMILACAGQPIAYMNCCYDRRIGVGVGGNNYVF